MRRRTISAACLPFVSALAILCAGAAFLPAARSTPIVGSLQDVTGAAYSGALNSIQFRPFAVAAQNGSNTVWPVTRYAVVTNGVFALNLIEGFYYASPVSISLYGPVPRPVAIFVPNDTNVWQFNQCENLGNFLSTLGQTNLTAMLIHPGVNVAFSTNGDGSITIAANGGGPGGSATNVYFISGTNTYFDTLNGSNRFSIPSSAFDAPWAAAAATNGLGSAAFKSANTFDLANAAAAVQINLNALAAGLGTVAALSSNTVIGMAGAVIAGSNYLTVLPGNVLTNSESNVWLGSGLTVSNANTTYAYLNFGGGLGNVSDYIQASPVGLTIGNASGGVLINGPTFTANAIYLNNNGDLTSIQGGAIAARAIKLSGAGGFSGDGSNLTNTPSSIVISGNGNVTVAPSTNAGTGQITYAVSATGGGTSPSSNNFVGSLNLGQIYGLGNVATLNSNQVIGMAVANVAGGSATNAIGPNGGTGTNINLTKTTTVDQMPELYATPTWGIFYGDSITQGNYVTNGYCADLGMMGFQRFAVADYGVSSSHITDVSNLFYGSLYSGSRSYTNYPKPGTNFWVSFWVGINDCLYGDGVTPFDTNTWINSYTNMWWLAHSNGASSVFVFTIEDSTLLSLSGETNRALLNSLIMQNAQADAPWVILMNNSLILPSTNSTYFLYNATANYGLHPNDYGHSLVAQALASQMVMATNLSRGAYFAGPVWSSTGFGGNGSNLLNVPATLGGSVIGGNTSPAVGMLGVDANGLLTSNAVPTSSGSTSSNNFVGSLNVGQVYGLGGAATLSSNALVNMATNKLGSAAYAVVTAFDAAGAAQNATNQLASGAFTAVGSASILSSNQILGMASALGGAATNLALGVPATGSNSATAIWMLGIDASGRTTSNAVPTTGASTSSNNFVGNLNVGQVYGLGTVSTLSSNTVLGMAGAAIAGSNYLAALPGYVVTNNNTTQVNINNQLTIGAAQLGSGETWFDVSGAAQLADGNVMVSSAGQVKAVNFVATTGTFTGDGASLINTPGSIVSAGANVSVTPTTNAATGQITYAVASSGGAGGIPSTVTNLNLTKITSVDQLPVLYATPTIGVLYGDTITQGNYVTNDYAADLGYVGWQHFTAVNNAMSSSHLTDVSNSFYGTFSGTPCYTNWVGAPGTNAWVSFWIGVNDCNTWPLDTNTWIASFTNMWWAAHTNGANPVVVFTIADSMQLSAGGETNRALLNSLITQNAMGDNAWVVLMNNDLILPSTNSSYFLYNATAGYGVFPNDRGHSLVAQALASQLLLQTNLSRGAYFNGPVWSTTGFGGNGSNLFNLPAAKVVGVLAPTNVPVNTVVGVGSGLTVASNSVGGVQTYTVGVGSISAASPFLSQRIWAYMPSGSGTTLNGFGQSGSTGGTLGGTAETATDPYSIILSTTTTVGNYTSLGDNQKTITAAKPLMLVWRMGLTNTANVRVWMAVSDAATIATGDVSRQCMGFLYTSTNNGDWQFVTQNGSGHIWTDTGIAADTGSHTFELSYDGSANVYGYIDNACVATNTSDLLTSYLWGQWLTVTSLTTNTVGVRFIQFYGQQGF